MNDSLLRNGMKTIWSIAAGLLITMSALAAAKLPYDETSDAKADLKRALIQAHDSKKKVLVVFGANWCPDCRRLDKAIYDNSGKLGDNKFVIVKVDVGNFDKNLDLANAYDNPIKKGIPAAVVLAADNEMLYKGPLEYLINPYRRMIKMAVYIAAMVGTAIALTAGFLFLRRKIRSARFADPNGSSESCNRPQV
jgi:thioredoxin 1